MFNPSRPSIPQVALGGGDRGSQIQKSGKAVKRLACTDWHQIWYTSADSSGNGHRLNTIRPSIPWGVLGGHIFKSIGKLSNSWTDWHQIWYTTADSSGNGHRLNICRPSIYQGAFWGVLGGHKFKSMLKLSNGWTDWHQILHTCAESSDNGYTQTNCPSRHKGGT